MIKSFNEFILENYNHYRPEIEVGSKYPPYNSIALGMEDLFQLHESGIMPKFTVNDFKSIFVGPLMESEGYVDSEILEKSHAYYELAMLGKNKSDWLESEGEIYSISAGDHRILIKNNEAFIISESTLRMINESWSWDSAVSAFNSIKDSTVSFIKSSVGDAGEAIKKAWDAVALVAKKAYELTKTLADAADKFLKEMTALEWASLSCGILAGIIGAVGAGNPAAGITSGVLLSISGGIHIYEGVHKYNSAVETLNSFRDVSTLGKNIAAIGSSVPDILLGTVFNCLGVYDIIKGISALANPAAAGEATGFKVQVESSTKQIVKKLASALKTPGHVIHKALEEGVKMLFPVMKTFAKGKLAATLGTTLVTLFGHLVISTLIDNTFTAILKGGKSFSEGIIFLLDLPGKISSGIGEMINGAKTTIEKIIAKGLETLVKPLTDSAKKFIEKYIKPAIEDIKTWFEVQILSYTKSKEILKAKKEEIHSALGENAQIEVVEKPLINPKSQLSGEVPPGDRDKLEKVDKYIYKPQEKNPGGYKDSTSVSSSNPTDWKSSYTDPGYGLKPPGWKSVIQKIEKSGNPEIVKFSKEEGVLVHQPNSDIVYSNKRWFQYPKGKWREGNPSLKGNWKFTSVKKSEAFPQGLMINKTTDK